MFEKLFELLGDGFYEEKSLLKNGKPRTTYNILTKKKKKLDGKGIFLLGIVSFLIGKYNESIEYILFTLKTNTIYLPLDTVYEILGVSFYKLNNNLESKKYFIKALEENPENFESKYNLANIFLLDKNFDNAYRLFKELECIDPENNNIKQNLNYLENKVSLK